MFREVSGREDRRVCAPAWVFSIGLLMAFSATAREVSEEAVRWTLDEALDRAFASSPTLQARQAELEEVASRLVGARTYPYNPEVSLEVADRSGLAGSTTDRSVSVSQELELAGQRRKRIVVANEELSSAEAAFLRQQRVLAFRVESAFAEALRERELLEVAETDAALAREVLDFSQRRLQRGAATQIEVNLARASAGRAERSVQRAGAASLAARSRLAELAGADPEAPPEPAGELVFPVGELPPLEELLARAFERRGDFQAARNQQLAAAAAIRLALAEGRPNLVVGSFFQREEVTDDIFGATIGISLPLFNRNQGRIAESRAQRERVRYEQDALRLAIEREVTTAFNDFRAAQSAAEFLRDQVLGTLEENVFLLQRSFAAGRIGATEVVTLRREFVASRREYIEVLADAWLARLDLELATGHLTPPQMLPGKELP